MSSIIHPAGGPRRIEFKRYPFADKGLALVTTRDTGADPDAAAWPGRDLAASIGLDRDRIAWCAQVHGARILASTRPGKQGEADALVTDRANLVLSIRTADCLPLFLADPDRGALGLVHAGWRSAAAGLPGATVRAMRTLYGCDPGRMWAGIGPCIGPDAFEVGEEVAARFAPAHVIRGAGRITVDLPGAVQAQLIAEGVPPSSIEGGEHCTLTHPELFYSYRGEQTPERLFSLLARSASTRS